MKNKIILLAISLLITINAYSIEPYKNTKLSPKERAKDLVSRMTIEEKISQMMNESVAIERLGVPAYNWWNECLHGVARNGVATVFPQAVGMAATWDKKLFFEIGNVISDEARAKHHFAKARKRFGLYEGLTFWSPNINIFRDPRWGRGMETYGEDPYLTGQLANKFIVGLQGNDPKYFKVIATSKHYAVHSGPEFGRHSFNSVANEYDLRETYLPAFKTTVQDAKVYSIMCAYNRLNGMACCSNSELLHKILREEWKFNGYVVSDCDAILDIYKFHQNFPTAHEAALVSVKTGTDLECGNVYQNLNEALSKGLIKESELDVSLIKLFEARFRLGMFDPEEMVPYAKIPYDSIESVHNQNIALQTARESIVLLKNQNNILPLSKEIKSVAVIGPNADDLDVIYGNYHGYSSNPITPLKGIKNKLPNAKITFERGCDLTEGIPYMEIIPSSLLFTSIDKKQNGLNAEYYSNRDFAGEPSLKRIDTLIDYTWWEKTPLPYDDKVQSLFSIRWTGYFAPQKTGNYYFGAQGFNAYQIFVDDSMIINYRSNHEPKKQYKQLYFEAGKLYKLKVEYKNSPRTAFFGLYYCPPDDKVAERAIEAVKNSDITIAFMGISPRVEGEELKGVDVKGFHVGDRTNIDLPETQSALLKQLYQTGKPIILVLLNGSALAINWEAENIPAIVEAWYGGQASGTSIADVLFGDYNPSGKLPITFYKDLNQLPDFFDYNMRSSEKSLGRTYRYFKGDVIYPFGYGLSYTTFDYKNPKLSKSVIKQKEKVKLTIDITNTGNVLGEEVLQLYVKGKENDKYGPLKTLKGFERIKLEPNQTKKVEFEITPETLQVFKEGKGFVVEKGKHTLLIGNSSDDKNFKSIQITVK